MLLASNDNKKLKEVKTELMNSFEMIDLGEPKNFLGMNIKRDTKAMTITQEKYIDKILTKFGFDNKFPQNTPMITRQVANQER